MDDQAALDAAIATLAASAKVAVDTEADSRHRYPEKVCLVQLSDGVNTCLVDTLASLDYGTMGDLFADGNVQKVLHGADFDIRGLHRDFGFTFSNCYDTSIAARFAGLERLGLAPLLEDILDIRIPKDQRLRRADWSRRPLEREALDYAAGDVTHLVALRDALDERLQGLGRDSWVAEECARLEEIRYSPPNPEFAYLSVKGTQGLDGRALAVLKSLFELREAEAVRLNRPPGYLIPASAMTFLSAHPEAELAAAPGLGASAIRRYGHAIQRAVRAGVAATPLRRRHDTPPPLPRPTHAQAARFTRLKTWRANLGAELAVDPSVLWSMRSLERLARDPGGWESEVNSPEVRTWQRERFGASLSVLLSEMTNQSG